MAMRLMTLLKGGAAAAALVGTLSASAGARAQYVNGFYISGGLGLNILQDLDTSRNPAAGGGSGQAVMDPGFAGLVAIGWGFGNGIRAELEGNYRVNDVDRFGGFGGVLNGARSDGTVTQYGVMLNAWWDNDFGWPVIPTIGAGIGYAWADLDNVRAGTLNPINGTESNFAYQLMAGLLLPLDAAGQFAATLEYRFFSILSNDFKVQNTAGKADVDDLRNHSVLIGLRYAFNPTTTPPAPAVAAAPAPARTFLVFFDFNRADLTDRARSVIAEAANAARTTETTRIEVSGHTDTVGSAQYNQGLSMRRAESVAAELERRGIPRNQMVLQAFGFTRLLVPTGPNVREPQNRRVEIVLR
jgi:OOP family OmpA-OmpF porin